MPEPKQIQITILEETYQTVRRRVADAAEFTPCCKEFKEEYGRQFRLLCGGGIVPAAARIERTKMGKIVQDQPKIGWLACPYCFTQFVTDTVIVKKRVSS